MSIVTDFKAIKRVLDRQEQKADFEAKQPTSFSGAASRFSGGSCESKTLLISDLPRFDLPDLRGRVKAEKLT